MCSASHVSHPLHVSLVGSKLGMVFAISLWRSMICIAKPEDACHANERRNVSEISRVEYSLGKEGTHQYGSVPARHPDYQV